MDERNGKDQVTGGSKNAIHLGERYVGAPDILEDFQTHDGVDTGVPKRQRFTVSDDMGSNPGRDIHVPPVRAPIDRRDEVATPRALPRPDFEDDPVDHPSLFRQGVVEEPSSKRVGKAH
jgi:hypothetical protein